MLRNRFCDDPDAADRGLDAGLGEALGVFDRDVLNASVAMMHEAAAVNRSAFKQRLLERVEDEPACAVRAARQPTIRRAKASITKAT